MFPMHLLRGRTAFAALVVALVVVAACSKSSKKPTPPEVPVAPTPNTPVNALRLLEYCWDQKSLADYRSLLDGDFAYVFAPVDTPAVHPPLNRDQELTVAGDIFTEGGNGFPAASADQLALDATLTATPDDRPGRNSTWHKRIDSNAIFRITNAAGTSSASDPSTFYVTRGDSANLTTDQLAAGAVHDSTRWYLDTWADNSTCPGALGKLCVTVGRIKLSYAPSPAATR